MTLIWGRISASQRAIPMGPLGMSLDRRSGAVDYRADGSAFRPEEHSNVNPAG
jgi:hypothetical protein